MATTAELEVLIVAQAASIAALVSKVDALVVVGRDEGHCTAEYLHTGELNYSGGRYLCRCGMRYSKDGKGGLRVEG